MGDIKKLFKTEENLELNGVWRSLGDKLRVLVARWNNTNHKRIMEILMKPYQHTRATHNITEDVAEEILIKGMSKAILLDWEGMEEDGVPVTYSQKEAIRVLTEYKDFRITVQGIAMSMEAYQKTEDEEMEKNSQTSSTGRIKSGKI